MMRIIVQRCAANVANRVVATSASQRPFISSQIATSAALIGARAIHQTSIARQEASGAAAAVDQSSPGTDDGFITRFDELGARNILHPAIVSTLTRVMNLETMTEVQSKTITQAIKGNDIVAQAKTGTGKTLAFLMPILQNIISRDPDLARPNTRRSGPRTTADDIRALIVSPTRELAEQIAVEARRLVAGTSVIVQTAVGGTQKSAGLQAIQRQGCHILVGTPGRLKDILTDEYSRVQAPDLSALVFDEADRLLDQGFWPAIQEIMQILPQRSQMDRQTLMFSATVPEEVVHIVRSTLKPGFDFVRCVKADEEPTHARVPQKIIVTKGFENNIPALVELCHKEIKKRAGTDKPFKAIVYFPSTAEVRLGSAVFLNLKKPGAENNDAFGLRQDNHVWKDTRVFEIHAKLTQSQRTRAADTFRRSQSGILMSSDVTARGLDFPDVTHVIQVGTPPSEEQYIHRVGRTARAGKEGEGWLIVNSLELELARSRLRRLPIKKDDTSETAELDLTQQLKVSAAAGEVLTMVQKAMKSVNVSEKIKVYKAMLGVYQGLRDKYELIAGMNRLSQFGWGLREVPMIPPGLAGKLGVARIPGVRIGDDPRDREDIAPFSRRNDRGRTRIDDFGRRSDDTNPFTRTRPGYPERHGGRGRSGAPMASF